MAEHPKILCLDDEPEILNSLKRVFRKEFDVHTFEKGADALVALSEHVFPVVISDMKMPEMDGVEFLSKAKDIQPDSSRILLTGYSELDSIAGAVNNGEIFAFISKPWDNNEIKLLVENALAKYQLLQNNRKLSEELDSSHEKLQAMNQQLEKTVATRTKMLKQKALLLKKATQKQRRFFKQILDLIGVIIEDRAGHENGHSKRVAAHSKVLAEHMGLSRSEAINCYVTGLMHEVGKVAISDKLLATIEYERSVEQNLAFRQHAIEGALIMERLPSFKAVALNIRHQYENYDGSGFPDNLKGEEIPFGARLLKVVSDYDYLLLGHKHQHRLPPERAGAVLKEQSGKEYDRKIVDAYLKLIEKLPELEELESDYCIATNKLKPGMMVAEDVVAKGGGVMLTKDTIITESAIEKLIEYEKDNDCYITVYIY